MQSDLFHNFQAFLLTEEMEKKSINSTEKKKINKLSTPIMEFNNVTAKWTQV